MKKAVCKESNEIKYINDFEIIDNIKIYYMTDNTSYAEHQVNIKDMTFEEIESYYLESIYKSIDEEFKLSFNKIKSYISELERVKNMNFFEKIVFKLRKCICTPSVNT